MKQTKKWIKAAILLSLLAFPLFSGECLPDLKKMSPSQKSVFWYSYQRGKLFGYGETMAAIAWQESCLGKWKINLGDGRYGSFGAFHNLAESVLRRRGVKINEWTASRIAEKLITDIDFSFLEAMSEIKFWEKYWKSKGVKNVYERTVGSYNGRFRCSKKDFKSNLRKIRKIRAFVKKITAKAYR